MWSAPSFGQGSLKTDWEGWKGGREKENDCYRERMSASAVPLVLFGSTGLVLLFSSLLSACALFTPVFAASSLPFRKRAEEPSVRHKDSSFDFKMMSKYYDVTAASSVHCFSKCNSVITWQATVRQPVSHVQWKLAAWRQKLTPCPCVPIEEKCFLSICQFPVNLHPLARF